MLSITTATMTVSRLIAAIAAIKISPKVMLIYHSIICAAGEFLLLFSRNSIGFLWAGNVLTGFGISAIWPAQFAFFDDILNFSNSAGTIFIAFAGIANSITPYIIGERIEETPLILIYIGLAGLALAGLLFTIINVIVMICERTNYFGKSDDHDLVHNLNHTCEKSVTKM
jgi:fucose permease